MDYSPVAIFCYNRPDKLNSLINSLQKNPECSQTVAYFFVDIPKEGKNKLTEEILYLINEINFFKDKKIILRTENYGLSKNILNGVDFVLKENKTIICLEDDLIVSKAFLSYMNNCLDFYNLEKKVWHINGWSYPQLRLSKSKIVVGKLVNSWGWATWSDRWSYHDVRKTNRISKANKDVRKTFNFYGLANWEQQLKDNDTKKISTWAIFWYQTIFLNNGFSIYPVRSHVFNDGMDGTGENSGVSKIFDVKLNNLKSENFQNSLYVDRLNNFFTILFYMKIFLMKKFKYTLGKFQKRKIS